MSLKQHCTPRESVFSADRRATVLNLDTFLKGDVDGEEFFAENYFTNGMTTLVDRAFRHLGGEGAGSSIFLLSQAMGGGKTHSMIALGLLARKPELRKKYLAEKDPAAKLAACRVIGFNGRNTDAPGAIWGSIAAQLGKAEQFAEYTSGPLSAPGPEAWKHLLAGEPTIIFLDELPPYLEYGAAVAVGNSNLSVVTTTALANLFVAVSEMNNVCLILSDLAGTNYSIGQENLKAAFDRAVQGVTGEAKRYAVPITPVNPNGDELYHILRKRLFSTTAPAAEIERIAAAYRDALQDAARMNLTTTTPQSLYTRIVDSYPFHPDLRELFGKFKENEGFQQTRGVIRLMQMLVSHLWRANKAEKADLIHPYDLDFNVDEIASEIRAINPSLSEAIAHDIAHEGDAEVEKIDASNGNSDASDAARLLLIASLSTTPGAIHGLREHQLVDGLQRPGRDLSTFKANVMDKLAIRAWYLHTSSDGRWFFKNQQNLAAKLRSVAQSLHSEVVEQMLRHELEQQFAVSQRDCYQMVKILPPLDGVLLEQEKTTLIIVRPGGQANSLAISADWQNWWLQQQYKNRVLFLTGTKDTYQKVLDAARQTKALQSIDEELRAASTPTDDPQWKALDILRDRVRLQFSAALREAFDQVIYPSINTALRSTGIVLDFAGNQVGEAAIRQTLISVQKFALKTDDDAFRQKAEARLFGANDLFEGANETKVILWADFKRAAAVNTTWPLHRLSALEELKARCIREDLWREEGNYVRRGPFPPPAPEVAIRELSVDEDGDGITYLKVEPLHAASLVFETGDSAPTPASSPVPTPNRFEAKGLRYRFLAFDPADHKRISPVKDWTAKLRVKTQLINRGDHFAVELKALPLAPGIVIRYTTDGSAPNSTTAATYDGPIRVPAGCRVILAMASFADYNLTSETVKVPIPEKGKGPTDPDRTKPTFFRDTLRFDDAGAVWNFIRRLIELAETRAFNVQLTSESADSLQVVEFSGADAAGYDGNGLKALVEKIQDVAGGGALRMSIGSLRFHTGQALYDWLKATNTEFDAAKVSQ